MAHPYSGDRQSIVEKRRVGTMTRGYAAGGVVSAPSAAPKSGKSSNNSAAKLKVGGVEAKSRQDRPNRAKGGRVKSGKTNVNVIIGPQGGQASPPPGLAAGPLPAGPAPMARPPVPMPPPGPPGGGMPPGAGPGPMPIRASGGRTYAKGGRVTPVKAGSLSLGTKVENMPGKNDGKDIGRPPVITKATGGRITSENAPMGPKYSGGAGGGTARIEKEERADRKG